MDEKKIELGLSQALQKYGDKVYSLFICNLQYEFGSEVFRLGSASFVTLQTTLAPNKS
jgi:hypothetical protein